MKRMLWAMVLAVGLAFGTCAAALGVGLEDDAVFVKQSTRRSCTLTSATMLLRRKAIVDGDANWAAITDEALSRTAWSKSGLAWNFTYNGVNVSVLRKASGWGGGSLEEKKAFLLAMLDAHPEGVVAYNYSHPHAVLLTGYDPDADTFYCSDPAQSCPEGVIPLEQCIMDGWGQDGKLQNIDQLWYVSSGLSLGAGTMPTPVEEKQETGREDAVAWISAQDIEIDGTTATFQTYVVVDDAANETCYVNVVDLAAALRGSAGQFDVTLGEETLLRSGAACPDDVRGSWENLPPVIPAAPSAVVTRLDGQIQALDAIEVTDYHGQRHIYYKLRDLGGVLGLQVGWDAQRGVFIETVPAA